LERHRSLADLGEGFLVGNEARQHRGLGADFSHRVRRRHAERRADDLADPPIEDRAHPATQQIAELLELELDESGPVVLAIATGNGVDDATQERFVGRELANGAHELRQIGQGDTFARRPADFEAAQHAQLDLDPFADQLATWQQLEALQDPAQRVGIA
jgi:hypothetical protein